MSEIESLGRMRCELQICKNAHRRPTIAFMEDCADEIEAEIAERFVELPVDADGVPIHVGDKLRGVYETFEVCAVNERYAYWEYGRHWDKASECRHVEPRTLEDVLEEFADAAADVDGRDREEWVPLLAKYADEIRGMEAK